MLTLTFYAIAFILNAIGIVLLGLKQKEGWIPLGLSVAGIALFVPSIVSFGFITIGIGSAIAGPLLWRKE